MHVHGISIKDKKRNPNLTCEGQTTNKHGRQRLIGMKTGQNISILCKQNKETERLKQGKKGKGLRTYTSKHKAPLLHFDRFP